jgi:Flp pilus assembly protein TadD
MRSIGGRQIRVAAPIRLSSARVAVGLVLAAAITISTAVLCRADPEETDPEASTIDPDYAAGKQALERKAWREAARRFSQAALRDPDNADLHNYLGYSYRHLRQLDLAFKHYKRALSLNPHHRGAHEYVGEAYLMIGDFKSAERHLAALREICLLPCDELTDLEREIAKYRKKSGAGHFRRGEAKKGLN